MIILGSTCMLFNYNLCKICFNAHMLYVDLIIMMDDVLPSLRLGKFSDCAARHQYEKQEYRENDV